MIDDIVGMLEPDYSIDYWADEALPRLATRLRSLTPDDRDDLADAMAAWPAGQRVRLAEGLGAVGGPYATPLLVGLVRSAEPEVGAAAAAALLSLNYEWDPEVPLRADLQRHLDSAQGEDRVALSRLAGRVLG